MVLLQYLGLVKSHTDSQSTSGFEVLGSFGGAAVLQVVRGPVSRIWWPKKKSPSYTYVLYLSRHSRVVSSGLDWTGFGSARLELELLVTTYCTYCRYSIYPNITLVTVSAPAHFAACSAPSLTDRTSQKAVDGSPATHPFLLLDTLSYGTEARNGSRLCGQSQCARMGVV